MRGGAQTGGTDNKGQDQGGDTEQQQKAHGTRKQKDTWLP